ncbi:acyclic terpene utilization AtuA family protein [Clostridium sp. YIM B02506]|uniref:acyclic terpene utilization AtuA family protein n=1 Tax=Clostridium sp. YIM B02506 TaxID=2910680 RepID=UPI001EEF1DD0|nr:acyclic terpene utilization AtuA family protein [Clostridium sp. YIM B02506]
MKKVRVGSGAGYGGDRIEPAVDIMTYGNLDYIIFECLAERTISLAQLEKLKDKNKGYNELLEYRMEKIIPLCVEKKVKVITNMGAANPLAAAEVIKRIAEEKNIKNLKIAAVLGDDVFSEINGYMDYEIIETGEKIESIKDKIISANAYIGVKGIIEALENNADIIITGRVADPALVLAPLIYEFGWKEDEYDKLAKGIVAGHLLECGAQVCGGYYADPGYKDVPDLWNIGFPIADIYEDGEINLSKLEKSGGVISTETCKEQLIYEIHDPENYLTPDVIADFSEISVEDIGKDRVSIKGAKGKKKTGLLKTSVGYKDCYIGEGEISYGGAGAYERAKLAGDVIRKRLEYINLPIEELRIDFIGVNSLFKDKISDSISNFRSDYTEVRLRVAARTKTKEDAKIIGNEVEALYTNGPAAGGGVRKYVREIISIASILIPEESIKTEVVYREV